MMKAALLALAAAGALVSASAAVAGDESEARTAKRSHSFEWKAPFAEMSPQGVAIIREAMKSERIPSNAEDIRKARQRVLELLAAPKLDVDAIRKAQAEERAVVIKEHAVAQEKMLKAYQRLTLADRKAFVAGMRQQEVRMQAHMARARERMRRMQEQMKLDQEQMRREMENMDREVERVKKETGSLWIIVPPAPAASPAAPEANGRG